MINQLIKLKKERKLKKGLCISHMEAIRLAQNVVEEEKTKAFNIKDGHSGRYIGEK